MSKQIGAVSAVVDIALSYIPSSFLLQDFLLLPRLSPFLLGHLWGL